jgi:hypothetical protein
VTYPESDDTEGKRKIGPPHVPFPVSPPTARLSVGRIGVPFCHMEELPVSPESSGMFWQNIDF